MKNLARRNMAVGLFLLMLLGFSVRPAQAALSSAALTGDLNALTAQGSTLLASLGKITLSPVTMNSQLSQLATSVASYRSAVQTVSNTVASATGTITLTPELLTALQGLAAINSSLGTGLSALSQSMVTLAPMTLFSTLQTSMTTMLRLSDDIGVMANRILEMADKILAMADNIGLMADRILATQVIQSANLKMVLDAVLMTQQNSIFLVTAFGL